MAVKQTECQQYAETAWFSLTQRAATVPSTENTLVLSFFDSKGEHVKQNGKLALSLMCLGLLLFFKVNPLHGQTAQQIAKRAFGSTVLLVMEDANGQPLSLGSGFFVRDGEIASNLHVVEGATRGYAKLVGQKKKYDILGITAVDPKRDLVVLNISVSGSTPLPLGNSDAVQVGERVYAVGNPQGLEGTFSQGIVSSIREVGSDRLLQITAPISPGSSGGSVLNVKGQVIGVSVATYRGGQNLNFAIPSNYLKLLIEKIGPVTPLAQTKRAKAQSSILADLGGNSSEGVIATQLTWDSAYAQIGYYTFSFRNRLRDNVSNIHCRVVFYGNDGAPIDIDVIQYRGIIPAGLAKRVAGNVDESVQELTTRSGSKTPDTKVEIRILDFRIVE